MPQQATRHRQPRWGSTLPGPAGTVLQGRGFQGLPEGMAALLLLGWGVGTLLALRRPQLAASTARVALILALAGLGLGALAWSMARWLPVSALVLTRRVSPALLADILREPGPLGTQLGGSRARCAVLFTDLVGFTPLSAQLEPAALFALLNRYFEAIAAAVIAENGLLDNFSGDALMAEFGVPRSRGDGEEALAAQGEPPLTQGIGIHVGEVIAGNLGSSQRLEFTVVGAAVNVASDIQATHLIAFTETGRSARLISRWRSPTKLLAFTPDPRVRSQLPLVWGVETFLVPPVAHTDDMVRHVDKALLEIGRATIGERVVIVAGVPPGIPGTTNGMRVHKMGSGGTPSGV